MHYLAEFQERGKRGKVCHSWVVVGGESREQEFIEGQRVLTLGPQSAGT